MSYFTAKFTTVSATFHPAIHSTKWRAEFAAKHTTVHATKYSTL